ncbi:MAG: hypothetical protein ABIE07_10785 [Candidatus Zixiibacteriota bacterium]
MLEEEKTQSEFPESGSERQKPIKSRRPIMLIIIGVVGFVICVGAFSFFMGVFSNTPVGSGGKADGLTGKRLGENSKTESKNSEEEITAEIIARENELFGRQDMVAMENSRKPSENAVRGMTKSDSIKAVNWLNLEKEKLASEKTKLDARKIELDRSEAHLRTLLTKKDQLESERISSLAKLYDGMKAEQVAPLINKLTIKQAVDVLLKMKPANAARILGALKPDRAALISAEMITLSKE